VLLSLQKFYKKYHYEKNISFFFLFLFCLLIGNIARTFAQGVGVNSDNSNPDGSAILDVKSTTQGMLVPRMTEAQRNLVASPATGLLVYQTDATAGFYFYNGTAWTSLSGGGSSLPTQTGNEGKFLKTDGTNPSWANVGTNLEVIKVTDATTQTIAIGSTNVVPSNIRFQANPTHPASIIQTLTGGNTFMGDSLFTVGTSGAGLYNVSVQLVSNSTTNGVYVTPIIDVRPSGGANSTSMSTYSFYGIGMIAVQFRTGQLNRGQISQYVYLGAGDTMRIRGQNSSGTFTQNLLQNYCRLQIVRCY
jgi:hypothetical protein